jgi:glycosyltransferase involved in cell wall biosynthesis
LNPNIPDITIVVPTFNRQELLPQTLPALANLHSPGFTYEVIFANDGSSDSTADLIDDAVRRSPGKFFHLPLPHSGSPARPRNAGIRAARGRLVLLLDDDIIPDADLLLQHWRFHAQYPDVHLAATGELYQPEEVLKNPMSLFHSFPYHELRDRGDLGFLFYWSCNISAKTALLRCYGLFDEDPALHPVEDMEWGYRLVQNNMRLRFLPAARGKHLHKMDRSGVNRRGERTGRAQFALTLKVPDPSVKARFGIIAPDLPAWLIAWRALRRTAFRTVDNPLTLQVLKALGAESSERNRITDAYYYLLFRRATVAGYKAAKRRHRQLSPPLPLTETKRAKEAKGA